MTWADGSEAFPIAKNTGEPRIFAFCTSEPRSKLPTIVRTIKPCSTWNTVRTIGGGRGGMS